MAERNPVNSASPFFFLGARQEEQMGLPLQQSRDPLGRAPCRELRYPCGRRGPAKDKAEKSWQTGLGQRVPGSPKLSRGDNTDEIEDPRSLTTSYVRGVVRGTPRRAFPTEFRMLSAN